MMVPVFVSMRLYRINTRAHVNAAALETPLLAPAKAKVACKVDGEARQPSTRQAEADAISARLRRSGEHGLHLAPRVAAAKHSRAPSGGWRTTRFHEHPRKVKCRSVLYARRYN